MFRNLPSQRNLEGIKKEAKNLLFDLSRWDAAAVERLYSLDSDSGRFQARLADAQYITDAQYIIAREYGSRSWQKLKERMVTTSQACPSLADGP
jgi:hypothetical protein